MGFASTASFMIRRARRAEFIGVTLPNVLATERPVGGRRGEADFSTSLCDSKLIDLLKSSIVIETHVGETVLGLLTMKRLSTSFSPSFGD